MPRSDVTRNRSMMRIGHPKDFWSGVLFSGIGAFALIHGTKYTIGTAARMGPGYFPRILGIMMVVIGLVLVFRSLRTKGDPVPGDAPTTGTAKPAASLKTSDHVSRPHSHAAARPAAR